MPISDFNLFRLSQDHVLLPFDCNDSDLNSFLFDDAKKYQEQLLAVTYLLESKENTVVFFSIFNDKITVDDFESKTKWKKLVPHQKRKRSYPAVKLGRLGIDVNFQGIGLGTDILNYIKILFIENNKTGCKFITVDAYRQSLEFYKKNGFDFMTSKDESEDTRLMFFDLSQLL